MHRLLAGRGPLALVLLLAILVRCYRLPDQSLWWDEYLQVGSLRVPDFGTYITTWLFWSADNVPLYQTLLWGYHHLISSTVLGARLLSVSFGMVCVLLLYRFTLRHFGGTAAFWAGIFVALSAHHTWYAQAIRPYGLLEMLVMCSWVSLFAALRTNHRAWWGLHLVANLAALATHPFVVFLFAIEGLLLLLTRWQSWRLLLLWGGVHIAAGVVLLFWLVSHAAYLPEKAYDHYYLPEVQKVLFDFLADDAVMKTNEFGFPITSPPVTWFVSPDTYLSAEPAFEYALMLLSLLAIAGGGLLCYRRWRCGGFDSQVQAGTWLLAVFLGPSSMLLLLTLLWRPMFETRYSTYCSFALYALLGMLLAQVPSRKSRTALGLACVLVFSYHLAALMSGTTRADWSGVARSLEERRAASEPLYVHFGGQWNDEVLAHAAGISVNEVEVAYSVRGLCEKAQAALGQIPEQAIWMAVADMATPETAVDSLRPYFPAPAYELDLETIPGAGPISLYRVRRLSQEAPALLPSAPAESIAPLLYEVDPALEPAATELRLGRIFDAPIPPSKLHYFVLAMFLYDEGDYALGSAASAAALRLDPDYPAGKFARSIGLAFAGDRAAAWSAYLEVRSDDTMWMPLFEPFLRAALLEHEQSKSLEALRALEYSGFPFRSMHQLFYHLFPSAGIASG